MDYHRNAAKQAGAALISAIWLTVVVFGVVTTGTLILQSHRAQTRINFAQNSQALQIARSGLTEARRSSQSVGVRAKPLGAVAAQENTGAPAPCGR